MLASHVKGLRVDGAVASAGLGEPKCGTPGEVRSTDGVTGHEVEAFGCRLG